MKKRIASIFLTLVLTLSLAGTALAAGTEVNAQQNLGAGKTVTAKLSQDGTYIDLTVTGLTSKNQYLVLMVSGIYENALDAPITESTIKYIDQASADGTVKFKVYPSSMQSSTILLSGSDVPLTVVATVEMLYIRGDANGDNKANINDASAIARHVVHAITLTGDRLLAADVTNDGKVNINDASKIARYVVHAIDSLD